MQVKHDEALAIDALLNQVRRLHTPPEIANSLLALMRDDDFDVRQVVDCVARDPAMTARILRLVNSSRYGLRNEVSSLAQAILLLGSRAIRLLALTFAIVETFTRGVARCVYVEYWRRAITMAVFASRLAKRDRMLDCHEAYTAGLLADVGILAMARAKPQECQEIYHQCIHQDELVATEQEKFGLDHAATGARLLERWRLPQQPIAAIRAHHHDVSSNDPLAVAIRAASLMADVLWNPKPTDGDKLRRLLLRECRLDLDEFCELALKTKEEVELEAEVFGFHLGRPMDCAALLNEARRRYFESSLDAAMDLDSLHAALEETHTRSF